MRPRNVPADHQLLPAIHPALDPGACALPRLIRAVLAFPDHTLKPLLTHSGKHAGCGRLELFGYADTFGAELQGLQHLAALDQRQLGQIAVVENEQVEDEIVDVGCSTAKVLKQVEVRSASYEGDNFSIDNRAISKLGQCLNNVRV